MVRVAFLSLAASAALAFSSAGNAAQFLEISGGSGVFAADEVSGEFTRTFNLGQLSGFRLGSFDIISIAATGAANEPTNIDFSSVTFNGVEFTSRSTGRQEFRNLFDQRLGGDNTIVVRGVAGANASFSGTISLAAIPEPATWAMMVGGFGMIGAAVRRRSRVNVAFA